MQKCSQVPHWTECASGYSDKILQVSTGRNVRVVTQINVCRCPLDSNVCGYSDKFSQVSHRIAMCVVTLMLDYFNSLSEHGIFHGYFHFDARRVYAATGMVPHWTAEELELSMQGWHGLSI